MGVGAKRLIDLAVKYYQHMNKKIVAKSGTTCFSLVEVEEWPSSSILRLALNSVFCAYHVGPLDV